MPTSPLQPVIGPLMVPQLLVAGRRPVAILVERP